MPASDDAASPFAAGAIDPETAAFNARIEQALAAQPPVTAFTPAEIRAQREAGKGALGPIVRLDWATERVIPGPGGPLTLRVFRPETVRGVYLHLHGGGFALGRAHHQDQQLAAIATTCEVAVVSVDYRLAPEHPHPAAPDDCEAAAVWLVAHAARELGAERLLIGGESAGANLAVTTLVRMRDRHGFTGFAAANLGFGIFDQQMSPSARRWGDRNLILSTPLLAWFHGHYAPPERRGDPDVSPLFADLARLPPALVTVGTLDPLLDDSLFMHARWLAAGNTAELAVYPGGVHGFISAPIAIARHANARIHDFIARAAR